MKMQETYTVKTYLRPDIHEYFPVFSEMELVDRLKYSFFHQATLLTAQNIATCQSLFDGPGGFEDFLNQDPGIQRTLLCDVLRQVGISGRTVKGMSRVRRELFIPPGHVRNSYLNTFVTYDHNRCVSMPGLIALMIDRLDVQSGQTILEVGIGSGYHAACIHEILQGNIQIYGIEISPEYAIFGKQCLAKAGYHDIQVVDGDGYFGYPQPVEFDRIYVPAANRDGFPERLVSQMKPNGLIQGVRPLTAREFHSEPTDSWLREYYGSYEKYLTGRWQKYCCLTTCQRDGDALVEVDAIYDVQFTTFERSI